MTPRFHAFGCHRIVRHALASVIALGLAATLGCDDDHDAPDSASPLTAAAPSATPAAASSPTTASAKPESDTQNQNSLDLRELTFTSNVDNKEPADVLLAAEPGKRVWAHMRIRNRNDETRKIHLEFRVNDAKRTTLDLKVTKSWSYRTWAYNTLLEGDKKGKVSLTVTADDGTVLAETSVPIAPKAKTKPYVGKSK